MKKISVSRKQAGLLALFIILVATNVTFAVIYFTKNVTITGGVNKAGTIEVYDAAGTTVMNNFDFEDFVAGVAHTGTVQFTIKNIGNIPVYVYWQITNPLTWTLTNDRYRYDEASVTKYYLVINKQGSGIWQPYGGTIPADTKILLNADQSALLSMDLQYTGDGTTFDALFLTVSFTARDS